MTFTLVVAESDILPIDVPIACLQLSDQRAFGYLSASQQTVRTMTYNFTYNKNKITDLNGVSENGDPVAKQADGAAVLRMGNTVLLATVCAAKDAVPGTDFMPLPTERVPNVS